MVTESDVGTSLLSVRWLSPFGRKLHVLTESVVNTSQWSAWWLPDAVCWWFVKTFNWFGLDSHSKWWWLQVAAIAR